MTSTPDQGVRVFYAGATSGADYESAHSFDVNGIGTLHVKDTRGSLLAAYPAGQWVRAEKIGSTK